MVTGFEAFVGHRRRTVRPPEGSILASCHQFETIPQRTSLHPSGRLRGAKPRTRYPNIEQLQPTSISRYSADLCYNLLIAYLGSL